MRKMGVSAERTERFGARQLTALHSAEIETIRHRRPHVAVDQSPPRQSNHHYQGRYLTHMPLRFDTVLAWRYRTLPKELQPPDK
jgi:hypothetical protein